ncbi:hypothetical protein Skr01_18490 [Sphaerisporangium krabiense]|nr:hypothetical protein Skr01_18490 [Sphaerisporangium krabiense]
MAGGRLDRADDVAGSHDLAATDRRANRQVCGAQSSGMNDHHDAPSREGPGVSDDSRARRHHRLPRFRRKIHSTVAHEPRLCRRREATVNP